VLHGREPDCAALRELLDAARLSRSAALVVRGEPGVGKTALLEYAAEHAAGLRVLRGTGVQSEVTLPFAALHQLLYPVLDQLPGLPTPQSAALSAAFGLTPGRSDDPFLVAVAVLSLVSEVSAGEGLLCLVDDAQWLDGPSADALIFVARRLDAEGVVLLFGARDDNQRNFTAAGLPELRLTGLEPVAAAALLQETAPGLADRVRDQLVTRTTGNPLALLELPAMLTAAQRAGIAALPEPLPLGRSVERIFAERVSQLSPAAQHLLLVGSAEETGDLAIVLRAAAAQSSGPAALEEAERAGLISVQNGRLQFRHPLVRSAVYQHATFSSRQDVHRSLAKILSGTEDVDRRAWHLAAAAVEPDESVAAALENSADPPAVAAAPGRRPTPWNGPRSSLRVGGSGAGGSPPLRTTPGSPASEIGPRCCSPKPISWSKSRRNERGSCSSAGSSNCVAGCRTRLIDFSSTAPRR
jgi:hypothetical protein